jgi:adenylate cyclase
LAVWLTENAGLALPEFYDAFCHELASRGLPLWRVVLGTETLHPEELGGQIVWVVDETATLSAFYHGMEATPAYLDSPLKIVDETGEVFRRRLDENSADMPLLRELLAAGATDYFIYPLPFLDRDRSAFLSFATTAPGGFTDGDIADLGLATRLFSPYAERRVLRRIAIDLLDTYLGHNAGERIFSGRVVRG